MTIGRKEKISRNDVAILANRKRTPTKKANDWGFRTLHAEFVRSKEFSQCANAIKFIYLELHFWCKIWVASGF
jgi:hypothetical protein